VSDELEGMWRDLGKIPGVTEENIRISNFRRVLNVVPFLLGESSMYQDTLRLNWILFEYKSEFEPTSSALVLRVSAL
jgi:hypothetical protein